MKELKGLMAVFTSPRGNVVSVANFDKCNGFEEYRIRRQLAREVAQGYCAPDFFEHMDAEACHSIMMQMCINGGCKVTITPITAPVEEPCQK